jgi:glycerol uptake facilitator-like aquaporin
VIQLLHIPITNTSANRARSIGPARSWPLGTATVMAVHSRTIVSVRW